MERFLLKHGAAVPVLYLGAVLGAAWFYPGYDHVGMSAGQLGAAASPHREIFNYGVMAAGAFIILGAFGVFLALHRLSRRYVVPTLATVALGLWGIALIVSGAFPMPDPRHNAYGLGLSAVAATLLLVFGLGPYSRLSWLKALSMLVFLAAAGLLAVIMGAGRLIQAPMLEVHPWDAGLWQRAYAAVLFLWFGLACLGLHGAATERIRRATRRETRLALGRSEPE